MTFIFFFDLRKFILDEILQNRNALLVLIIPPRRFVVRVRVYLDTSGDLILCSGDFPGGLYDIFAFVNARQQAFALSQDLLVSARRGLPIRFVGTRNRRIQFFYLRIGFRCSFFLIIHRNVSLRAVKYCRRVCLKVFKYFLLLLSFPCFFFLLVL